MDAKIQTKPTLIVVAECCSYAALFFFFDDFCTHLLLLASVPLDLFGQETFLAFILELRCTSHPLH